TDEYSWVNQWLSVCKGTIGIIGRSRKHLKLIQSSIDIAHQAVALEPLIHTPLILDLMSLTLTLYSPDSISDIAVQSLPSLGISWDQMTTSNFHPKWLQLNQQIQELRAMKLFHPPSECVIQLANLLIPNWETHDTAYHFFETIDQLFLENIPLNRETLEPLLSKMYPPETHDYSRIKLMTIHQSKGLEFDHVIIPETHKTTIGQKDQLLYCHKYHPEHPDLIGTIHDEDQHLDGYNFLIRNEIKKSLHDELKRLFYVASTRAKKTLLYVGLPSNNKNSFSSFIDGNHINALSSIDELLPSTLEICD
ncbi:MAG: hypothetical protein CMF41_03895, partial [Legionellales bacterium]